jgi:outer membrane autotransporter protein
MEASGGRGMGMIRFDNARATAGRPRRIPTSTLLTTLAAVAAAVVLTPVDARAACSPVTGPGTPSGTTVTCSGTVVNQDDPNGYGTAQQDNDVVNLTSGASVTGSTAGLDLGASNTVNLAAGSSANGTAGGIVLGDGTHAVHNDNGGTISASGNVSTANGISANFGSTLTVTNTGTISGTTTNANGSAFGVNAGDVNVTNSGTISATIPNGAFESVGIQGNTVTVANNGGTISASGTSQIVTIGIFSLGNLTVTANTGTISGVDAAIVNSAGSTLNVTNNVGGTIQATSGAIQAFGQTTITNAGTITGNFAVGVDSSVSAPTIIFNAGTITGTGGTAVRFSSTSTGNTLTLAPGFTINGTVGGGTGNILQLGGAGAGTFNASTIGTQYLNFTTFNKIGTSTFDLIGSGNQAWSVQGGVLLVDGAAGIVTVQSGATAGGSGTVGGLVVGGGATAAPGGTLAGPSIGTLNVAGNVSFAANSLFQVSLNPAQASRIAATGTTTLSGGTVQVLAAAGAYAPTTKYTIITSTSGVSGTFANVTSNLAFLTPTLSYDANDVFLTLARNNFSFASDALTPNQASVGAALDSAPQNAALIQKLLLQTDAGIRQAFDALSGEIFASTQSLMIEDALLARQAILARLLQIPYAGAQGPMAALASGGPALAYAEPQRGAYASAIPVKAPAAAISPDLVYWAQGVGAWGRINGDGNAAEARRDLAGVFTGFDRRFGDWRAGIAAGYTSSNVDVSARASSASINTGHLAAYAGTSLGAWTLRGGADVAWSAIDTNRSIVFPGLAETANAHFNAGAAQFFGEVGYGVALGQVAAEPFAGVAWVHLHTDGFAETGGLAALEGAAGNEDVAYTTLGAHLATSWALVNGMTLTPRVSAAWQHAFGDVSPATALTFQTLGTSFATAGAPIARDSAVVDAGLDLRVAPQATLGLFYLGRLAGSGQDNSVRGGFTWRF